jgi:hypothetical protein
MGTEYSTNGDKGMYIGNWCESQKERERWEDQDVGGWKILKIILREVRCNGMDWIDVVQDRDQWRALVNTVLNLRVP